MTIGKGTLGGFQDAERTALMVLGMHRSGTSALAGVLSHMGADLPNNLMAPTEMNAKGFFESQKMMLLNDDLLASAGLAWHSLQRFPQDWFESPKASEYLVKATSVLKEEFGGSHLFLMKDPRICKLLPLWHQALEEVGCRPLHVCVHRNPLDVAASLSSRYGYETNYGLLLWLRHVLDAEAESRGRARIYTSYDRVLEDWQREVRKIGESLSFKWPRVADMAAESVDDFLTRDLQHFQQLPKETAKALRAAPDWIRTTYEVFERWAETQEDEADHAVLDELRSHFDSAQDVLGKVAGQAQSNCVERDELRARTEALTAEVEAVRSEARGHANNHSIEQKSRQSAEEKISELTAALAEREEAAQALTDAQNKAAVLQGRNAALVSERDALQNSCARLEAKASEYREQIDANGHELHKMQSMLAQRSHELEGLYTQVQRDAGELEALREELASTEAERTRLHASLGHATRHLNELTRRASLAMRKELQDHLDKPARDAELKSLSQERDALREQVLAMQETLSEAEGRTVSEREASTADLNTLRRQTDLLNTQIASSERSARQASDRARGLADKLEASERAYTTERAKVEKLRKELSDAQKQAHNYSEILESTSWKITSPLRRVKMLLVRRSSE